MRRRGLPGTGPLVLFTVLAQAAAGLAVTRFVLARFVGVSSPWGRDAIRTLVRPAPAFALALLVFGALFGLLHLGRPAAARFAWSGRATSWLSQEARLATVLSTVLTVDAILLFFGNASPTGHMALALAETVIGLVLVHAIAKVYRRRTVPARDTSMTGKAQRMKSWNVSPAWVPM